MSFLSFLKALLVSSTILTSPLMHISLTDSPGLQASHSSFRTSGFNEVKLGGIQKTSLTVNDLCSHLVLGDDQIVGNGRHLILGVFVPSHPSVGITLKWFNFQNHKFHYWSNSGTMVVIFDNSNLKCLHSSRPAVTSLSPEEWNITFITKRKTETSHQWHLNEVVQRFLLKQSKFKLSRKCNFKQLPSILSHGARYPSPQPHVVLCVSRDQRKTANPAGL